MEGLTIAVVANSIPKSETMIGGYRIAIECAKRWLARGHEVVFLTNPMGEAMISRYIPRDDLDVVLSQVPLGLERKALHSLAAAALFYMGMSLTGLGTAWKASLPEKTVIYSVSPLWPDIFPGFLLRRRMRGSAWLVAVSMYAPPFGKGWRAHDQAGRGRPEKRAVAFRLNEAVVYPLIKRSAEGIFVNNELDRARAISDGFGRERVGVIGMGVDNSLAASVPEPARKEYEAVFIGRLHPQKGLLEFMDVWRLYVDRHPGARLAVIGNGPLEGQLREKIERHGLRGNVDMLGFLDGREKISVFKASRVVVHPSLYDSGGMAILEAMSCGLPGVSYDLPDLEVYYPQGMLKTPCYDQATFAANIELLLEKEGLYRELRDEALAWARQWDWDDVSERLLRLMERLFD
ncbi:MAG: glycosyltransferase family 4 protein [Actinomycetota bacterium]|nr:glycosyltransferase family 4 protein [Actinomycetota bacterium]MDD5667928.1 glycosyltransferase family 4 protein [Actinomycetota bacterium]